MTYDRKWLTARPDGSLTLLDPVLEGTPSTIKAELIWRRPWATRRKGEIAIFQYINGFCNPRRRHPAPGGESPVAFERKVA